MTIQFVASLYVPHLLKKAEIAKNS